MKKVICLTLVLLFSSVAMFADIARPKKTPLPTPQVGANTSAGMKIVLDPEAQETTLKIPRTTLRELRASLDDVDNGQDNTAVVTGSAFSRTQTFISGAFLSLALVLGGIWFVRSGKASSNQSKALVIFAVMACLGCTATLVYSNIAPPPPRAGITNKLFDRKVIGPFGEAYERRIRIERTSGEDVELIVPDPPAAVANAATNANVKE